MIPTGVLATAFTKESISEPQFRHRMRFQHLFLQAFTNDAILIGIEFVNIPLSKGQAVIIACLCFTLGGEIATVVAIA